MTFRRITMVAAATLLLAAATACSSDDSEGVPSAGGEGAPGADEAQNSAEQLVAYDECMREHGVDMPEDGSGDTEDLDVDGETLITAMEACEDLMPTGELELDEETVEELRVWAECMRDEGVDVPDPGPDGSLDMDGIDVTGDDYATADAAC